MFMTAFIGSTAATTLGIMKSRLDNGEKLVKEVCLSCVGKGTELKENYLFGIIFTGTYLAKCSACSGTGLTYAWKFRPPTENE